MIWEDMPDEQIVKQLREMEIESLVFNPSANQPTEGDFMSVMATNLRQLETAYKN